MKMVMISYNSALDGEVTDMLAGLGAEKFTKVPRALGKGGRSEPHLDTDVWPGTNCILFVAVEEELAGQILDKVRELRTRLGKEGIKAFSLSMDEATE